MIIRPIRVYNMEFSSIREACEAFQIPYTTVCKRIRKGFSVREALTKPLNGQQPRCKRGHLLSGENLLLKTHNGYTRRECRTCRNEHQKNRRKQLKAKEQGTNQ